MESSVAGNGTGLRVRSTGTRGSRADAAVASFVTDAGQVPPLSELQLPVPCSEGGWTPCQRDRKPADGREEGRGGRRQ